ncbi:DUF2334 domain-containing protein [Mycobacterium sp.]|uniref:DUF2334 domain-containing protein n=1 Tax=Mycobacterium sp. TaxID=1785 RepID=UPI003A8827C6
MAGKLLVSVSGITDRTLAAVDDFCARMDARSVPVSLLVAPCLGERYRLDGDPDTVGWITARRAGGDAVVLHGYDEAATRGWRGEFACLPAHEAGLRLKAADRVLEHLGLRTRVFAAPGWQVSSGVAAALPDNGFRLLVGAQGVTDLVRGTTVRWPVLTVGEGYLPERWRWRRVVMAAGRTARRDGMVRIAVAAPQLRQPGSRQALLDAVDLALLQRSSPTVYRWQAGKTVLGAA